MLKAIKYYSLATMVVVLYILLEEVANKYTGIKLHNGFLVIVASILYFGVRAYEEDLIKK